MRISGGITGRRYTSLAATFVVLAVLASIGHRWLLAVEAPVSDTLRGQSLITAFGLITFIGGTEVAIVIALGLAAATWRRCRNFAVAYPATLVVGSILNVGLKELIGRPRPPNPVTGVALASFPSGHSLQATLLLGLLPAAVYLLTNRPQLFKAAIVASAVGIIAVGASRVYLGAHWPTDVIGGILVGVGLIVVAERAFLHPRYHATCRCGLA